MRERKAAFSKTTALGVAIGIFVFVFSLGVLLAQIQVKVVKEKENLEVTRKHFDLVEDTHDFLDRNVSLLKGFSAYIQMHDEYPDEEVYELLSILLDDRLNELRNVTVFKDTTIAWIYPLKGNEQAIGVDLSKVPEQAEAVQQVKNNLETLFVGPIDLVQGGTGFIVRMPIMKDDAFWGMTSIVLKGEYAFSFIEEDSERNGIRYFITHHGEPEKIIHGDPAVLDASPLLFESVSIIGNWDMYVVPEEGWTNHSKWYIEIVTVAVLLGASISRLMYNWMLKYTSILDDRSRLERKSVMDSFTGIYNRDYFDVRVAEEIAQSDRLNHHLSLIYFDLDYFKEVNDKFGHTAGDKVLRSVVKAVEFSTRKGDVFARWGGDEFIILLAHTDLCSAVIVAEKLRSTVAALEFEHNISISASLGVSERVQHESWDSWFQRTDKALYKSKEHGRGRVTTSDHNEESTHIEVTG